MGSKQVATPGELYAEREHRKATMQQSNWIAAQEGMGPPPEYIPVSSTPLDVSYQKSKSQTRSEYLERIETQTRTAREAAQRDRSAPAADFIAKKHFKPAAMEDGTTIVFGSDAREMARSSTTIGKDLIVPTTKLDLLERVATMRDPTLDGSHRASMTEPHFLQIWDPYDPKNQKAACSFQSAVHLREAHHRHIRSQYHPDEKYVLPPTMQNDMGWNLGPEQYQSSCSKYQEGAQWHGRTGSHITKFAERLQLGARHHLSGPMTKPALHY